MVINNKILTIVIPCKNEGYNIIKTLDSIYKQLFIENIDVIIADNSDDNVTFNLLINNVDKYSSKMNIKIVKGGYPSEGRYNGSKGVKSEYLLFMDADIELLNEYTLFEVIIDLYHDNLDLITLRLKTESGYNYIYRFFDFFQLLGLLLNNVFAIGGFQLWRTDAYFKTGGYTPDLLFAEDYWISSKVDTNKFNVNMSRYVYTSARRFKNKGLFYMFKMMILSYLNRKNIEFFKQNHNYWI